MPETRELPEVINLLGDEIERALERLEAPGAHAPTVRLPRPRHYWRWSVSAAAVAAAVVVVVLLAATLNVRKTGPLSTEQAVAQIVKATLATGDAGARQYTFSRFTTRSLTPYPSLLSQFAPGNGHEHPRIGPPFTAFTRRTTETWISLRSTGFAIDHRGAPDYPTDVDRVRAERYLGALRRRFKRDGRGFHIEQGAGHGAFAIRDMGFNPLRSSAYGLDARGRYPLAGRMMSRREVLAFPTEPHAVIRRLRRMVANYAVGRDEGLWSALTYQYVPGYGVPLPARLRAGFVGALALVPGVESLGERVDDQGRIGLAFARDTAGLRQELVFDKQTGTLLHSSLTIVGRDRRTRGLYGSLPIGTVVESFTLVDQSVVNRLPNVARRVLRDNPSPRR